MKTQIIELEDLTKGTKFSVNDIINFLNEIK
jgi:hypothetical protein